MTGWHKCFARFTLIYWAYIIDGDVQCVVQFDSASATGFWSCSVDVFDCRWCMTFWTWCRRESSRTRRVPSCSISPRPGGAGKPTSPGRYWLPACVCMCERYCMHVMGYTCVFKSVFVHGTLEVSFIVLRCTYYHYYWYVTLSVSYLHVNTFRLGFSLFFFVHTCLNGIFWIELNFQPPSTATPRYFMYEV